MTPWQIIVANSLLPSGTAYEHIQAQRSDAPVQVINARVQLTAIKPNILTASPISRRLISLRIATPLITKKSAEIKALKTWQI